jgi:hypothetical protein
VFEALYRFGQGNGGFVADALHGVEFKLVAKDLMPPLVDRSSLLSSNHEIYSDFVAQASSVGLEPSDTLYSPLRFLKFLFTLQANQDVLNMLSNARVKESTVGVT